MPLTLQSYFLQIRPIDECAADDGTLAGHVFMNAALKPKKPRRREAVAVFISRTAMLREAPLANLTVVLQSIVCKESLNTLPGDVPTEDPPRLTAVDAETIGEAITLIRRSHSVPEKAVGAVLSKYTVLRATARQCAWFEPFLVAVLSRQMSVLTVKTSGSSGGNCWGTVGRSLFGCLGPSIRADQPPTVDGATEPAIKPSYSPGVAVTGSPPTLKLQLPGSAHADAPRVHAPLNLQLAAR
jgi:hypothetical protein